MTSLLSRVGRFAALSLGLLGCGPEFDPISEVKSLRVLAMQKDIPFPQPGETVNVSLLWHDGTQDPLAASSPPDVEIRWFTCFNPPGDDARGCFEQIGEQLLAPALADEDGIPEAFSFQVPADVIDAHSAAPPGQPRYGYSLVFASVCPGTLVFDRPTEEGALPIACRAPDGSRVSRDSFDIAQTALVSYAGTNDEGEPFRNANPIVTGFNVEGNDIDGCIDADCLGQPLPDVDCASTPERCFDVCKDDGEPECPKIDVRPLVDRQSAEVDQVSRTYFGDDLQEQMWINYYTDRGSVRGEGVRLLNDAVVGWSDDFATEFYAPKEPGPVTLWAVVHDARGGVSWIRTRIRVRERE